MPKIGENKKRQYILKLENVKKPVIHVLIK